MSLPWAIGLRYTASKRRNQLVSFISLLSMLGLVMGVALLLIVLSVMNGFDRELRERILGVMPQATVFHRQGIAEWPAHIRAFIEHKDVLAAAPFVQLQGLASRAGQVTPVSLYGVDAELEHTVSRLDEFVTGKTLAQLAMGEVLLGAGVARQLGSAVGDSLTFVAPSREDASAMPAVATFTVAGIILTRTEVDNGLAVVGLADAQQVAELGSAVTGIRLKIADLFNSRQVLRDLMANLSYGFYGSDWTRSHGNLFQAVQMSRKLVGLLLLLIIAIAAFNVVSTLVMVVVDKQGQIAILQTLGASRATIMGIFVVQGGLIGLVGTGVGLVLGVLGSHYVTDAVAALERVLGIHFLASDVYPVSYLPSDFRWSDCMDIGLVSLAMSLAATVYPAWRASRVQPAEALRYDR